MIRRAAILLVVFALALAAAGCGDDDDDGGAGASTTGRNQAAGARAAADQFVDCFRQTGFEAKAPARGQESVFASVARSRGYDVAPVNVVRDGKLSPSVFLAFFKSESDARKAVKELKATSFGDSPPAVRGSAVVGYLAKDERGTLEPAVGRCLT